MATKTNERQVDFMMAIIKSYNMTVEEFAIDILNFGFRANEKKQIKEAYGLTDEEVEAVVKEMKLK